MRFLKEVKKNTKTTRFIEHSGKKFRMTYDNRNGSPMGFDYRFQAEILKDDVWVTIAGMDDVGFCEISYVHEESKRKKDADEFFMLLQEHIELLY